MCYYVTKGAVFGFIKDTVMYILLMIYRIMLMLFYENGFDERRNCG